MTNIPEIFGNLVFNQKAMKERLPKETYEEFHKSLNNGEPLSKQCADVVAEAMKNWAIEKGATHFTHWASSQSFIGRTASGAKKQSQMALVFLSKERKWRG